MIKKLKLTPVAVKKYEAIDYFNWLNENDTYIRGICQSKGYWRNGGWNGMMDAISYVEKKELSKADIKKYNNNFFVEQVVKQYMAGKDYLELNELNEEGFEEE